jgi:hypothetical protein
MLRSRPSTIYVRVNTRLPYVEVVEYPDGVIEVHGVRRVRFALGTCHYSPESSGSAMRKGSSVEPGRRYTTKGSLLQGSVPRGLLMLRWRVDIDGDVSRVASISGGWLRWCLRVALQAADRLVDQRRAHDVDGRPGRVDRR